MGDFIGVIVLFAIAAGIMLIVDLFRKDSLKEHRLKEQKLKSEQEHGTKIQASEIQRRIDTFQREYGAAVSYYYNNALVDSEGIYIPTEVLGVTVKKGYLTLSELDDIKEKYESKMSNK